MTTQQTPYTTPPIEHRPDMQPPFAPRPVSPEYNEQFIEALAQRLMPRLMPEILYRLRAVEPERVRAKSFGMSLALAIVSIALMIPLTAIILGVFTTAAGGGIVPALIGLGVIGVVMVLINALFDYLLFNVKS
jgi:hypothetical protein